MPSIEVNPPAENHESETPTTQPIVGIIYPPPEVRNIVDKTASFVARNGPEFEARIRQNEIGNPKFNFLNFGDPYHAYYQYKVKDFREGRGQEPTATGPPAPQLKAVLSTAQQKQQQELLKQVSEQPFIPKDPPVEFEFIADPPSISALDLDIVKLTAQFVARNGRQFLTNLMNREQRNYQFDFLRPQHSLFHSMNTILDQVKYRSEWIKYQEAQRRKEEEELEKERVAYAQIDWHDFVVVETVDYQPFEMGNFPPPTTPDEVGARVLMQERIEEGDEIEMQIESEEEEEEEEEEDVEEEDKRVEERQEEEDQEAKEAKDNTQVQDMEEESSEEEDDTPPPPATGGKKSSVPAPPREVLQPPPLPPTPDKVVVKKGYDPKQAVKTTRPPAPDEFLISPLTGEKIAATKVQEHMRIGLLDPRWVEQRDKQIQDKINQETVYAPGSAIEASLKQLAERRTDIFGVGDEETAIGKKIGEEDKRKDEKVTWDGHTSSVEAATRAARANITLEEQIHQIHKVKGLLPDEEKEKIGPKPVASRAGMQALPPPPGTKPPVPLPVSSSKTPVPSSKPQAPSATQSKPQPIPPPVPVSAPPQQPAPPPPPPAPMALPPMAALPPPPGLLPPQPGMMMMPMRQPPLMVPARPPFPVAAPAPPMPGFMAPPAPQMQPPPPQPPPPSPVSLKVAVPNMSEKPEWRLKGQLLTLTLPLTDTVAVIKAKIHEETGMPPGKQKLHCEGLFFKDSNSLAFYNIMPGTIVNLQLKERGGRKK
ncbi:Splicing factor 3A subunit 1 [Blattella germanica]|nr:Splicing factor 3A subunit 1 [Blattella germanica]